MMMHVTIRLICLPNFDPSAHYSNEQEIRGHNPLEMLLFLADAGGLTAEYSEIA